MFTVYILFSPSINRYYTGFTSLKPEDRLAYHNAKNKGFTHQASDWAIIYTAEFKLKVDAKSLEQRIKKRGAKRYITDLDN